MHKKAARCRFETDFTFLNPLQVNYAYICYITAPLILNTLPAFRRPRSTISNTIFIMSDDETSVPAVRNILDLGKLSFTKIGQGTNMLLIEAEGTEIEVATETQSTGW